MKKRGILCIAALFTVLLLVGCDSKPSDMSDTAYRLGDREDESVSDLGVRIAITSLQVHLLSSSESTRDIDEKVEEDLAHLKDLLQNG